MPPIDESTPTVTVDLDDEIRAALSGLDALPVIGGMIEPADGERIANAYDVLQRAAALIDELRAARAALLAVNDLSSCRLREPLHADPNWIHDMREIARLSETP